MPQKKFPGRWAAYNFFTPIRERSTAYKNNKGVTGLFAKVSFMAPVTVVGALAGISMGKDLHSFKEQSWRMVIVAILVFTGTFVLSALVAQAVLSVTGAI